MIPSIGSIVSVPLKGLAKTRMMKWMAKNYQADSTRFIAGVSVTSIVLKDALGCYLYVKQSLKNEKIPKEKRGFVAALDLTNGLLMIVTQVAAFFTVSDKKFQEKIYNMFFKRLYDRPYAKGFKKIIEKQGEFRNITGTQFYKNFNQFKKESIAAFGVITSLVAATILAKRVIVPFIATPLADWVKNNIIEKKTKEPINKHHYLNNSSPVSENKKLVEEIMTRNSKKNQVM